MGKEPIKGPQFVRYFQPVIDALIALGGSGRPEEVEEKIAEQLQLTDETLSELTSSGQSRFSNKVNWARFYLSRAGLIDSSTRGVWNLTEDGRSKSMTQEQAVELFSSIHKQFSAERKKTKPDKIVEEEPVIPVETCLVR